MELLEKDAFLSCGASLQGHSSAHAALQAHLTRSAEFGPAVLSCTHRIPLAGYLVSDYLLEMLF